MPQTGLARRASGDEIGSGEDSDGKTKVGWRPARLFSTQLGPASNHSSHSRRNDFNGLAHHAKTRAAVDRDLSSGRFPTMWNCARGSGLQLTGHVLLEAGDHRRSSCHHQHPCRNCHHPRASQMRGDLLHAFIDRQRHRKRYRRHHCQDNYVSVRVWNRGAADAPRVLDGSSVTAGNTRMNPYSHFLPRYT